MEDYRTIAQLATELGMDRSGLRKYAISNGFEFVRVRTLETRGQPTLALSVEQAERLSALRAVQGYSGSPSARIAPVVNAGFFYVISLIPEFDPRRVKLGFAQDVQGRLGAHRTAAPTAQLVKSWPCRRSWESVAIESITRTECTQIGQEVFDCVDLDRLVMRAEAFFVVMPSIVEEVSDDDTDA